MSSGVAVRIESGIAGSVERAINRRKQRHAGWRNTGTTRFRSWFGRRRAMWWTACNSLGNRPQVFIEREAALVEFLGERDSDITKMPRFIGVTREFFFVCGVADEKAESMGVRGEPASRGVECEAGFENTGSVCSGDVDGEAALVL